MCQACPQYQPAADEVSDFRLRVMAEIHQIYRRLEEKRRAEMMAKLLGSDG